MKTKMTATIATFLALTALVGCGGNGSGSMSQSNKTITIQDMSPEAYYAQFIYKETDCDKDPYFHYLSTDSVMIGKSARNRDIRVQASIFLRANHTYTAAYEEHEVYQYIDHGYSYDITLAKPLSGNWQVVEDKIEIEGLGVGTSIIYNGAPRIELVFSKNINTVGLVGQRTLIRRVSSTAGERSHNEVCGGQ